MDDILDKVDEIIKKLKSDNSIKKMCNLKAIINSNTEIQNLLKEFNIIKDNNYSLVEQKTKLYNNVVIKEYLSIQNELDYLIMNFNSKLLTIVDNKTCSK